ncbi:MAG: hypothetical protein ACLFSQ_08280 [Candidatus Zixiibacteriota bacterium]
MCFAQDFELRQLKTVTGKDTLYHSWHISKYGDSTVIKSFYGNERWRYNIGNNGEINTLLVYDPNEDVYLWCQRNSRKIHFKGKIEGEKVDNTVELDDDLWMQHVAYCLNIFTTGDKEIVKFNVVHTPTMDVYKMRAKKEAIDTLDFLGCKTPARRLRFSFAGFFAPFWSASYWLSDEDGIFIKYRGRNSFPPAPITTIETISIETVEQDTVLGLRQEMDFISNPPWRN